MAHVQISVTDKGRYGVLIDGREMAPHIMAEGFSIDLPDLGPALVSMVIAADVLDIDLPEAAIKALREREDS